MLDISPLLLLFTAVVFLLILIFLNKVLYIPLLDFMKNRDDLIQKDRKNAGANESDILAYEEEAKAIIFKAKSEAFQKRERLLEQIKEDIVFEMNEKKAQLEEEYVAFSRDLQAQKVELRNGLLAQMPLFKEGIKAKLNQL